MSTVDPLAYLSDIESVETANAAWAAEQRRLLLVAVAKDFGLDTEKFEAAMREYNSGAASYDSVADTWTRAGKKVRS